VLPLALDVTDADAVQAAVDAAVARFGRLDVVVNNAGYANVAPVETGGEADFRAQEGNTENSGGHKPGYPDGGSCWQEAPWRQARGTPGAPVSWPPTPTVSAPSTS
jgi:Enoyl-(Acyl carrier protein) reductase